MMPSRSTLNALTDCSTSFRMFRSLIILSVRSRLCAKLSRAATWDTYQPFRSSAVSGLQLSSIDFPSAVRQHDSFPFLTPIRGLLDLTFFYQSRYKWDAVQLISSTHFFLSPVFAGYNSKNPYDVVSRYFPRRYRTF